MSNAKKPADAAAEPQATDEIDDIHRIDMNVPSALESQEQAVAENLTED